MRKRKISVIIFSVLLVSYNTAQTKFISDTNVINILYEKSYERDNLDIRIFRSINNSRAQFKDDLLDVIDRSVIFTSILTPVTQFVISNAGGNTYDENSAVLMAGSELLNLGLVYSTKLLVRKKRPYQSLYNVYTRKAFGDDRYSFPSGHSSITFTMATSYLLRYTEYPVVYLPIFAYALLTSYGRPYFGMHYPSDVLVGALYGVSSAIVVYSLRKPLIDLKNKIAGNRNEYRSSVKSFNSAYFASSFALSAILNLFVFKNNERVKLNIAPDGSVLNLSTGIRF